MWIDVPTPETKSTGHLAQLPNLPQVMGPPIPGEVALGGIAPHPLRPSTMVQALQSAWFNRDPLGYHRKILSGAVCGCCSLELAE